ncbi:hypothetical protein DFQ30_007055 [Apophysomyces sp. BC1015]|nr:hypothetical protein DFQ30_007055 [Apophysomyces sp. BC1015]
MKITRDQTKYCLAIMRNLKRHRDAAPFRQPVDYIKLNVPDYPKIIKQPMDLDTVDLKLNSGAYDTVEDMVADVRLVFSNCYKFNGPEAMISMLCQNVEFTFEKSLKQMPPSEEISSEGEALDGGRKKTLNPLPLMSRPKRDVQPPRSNDHFSQVTTQRNPKKSDIQMKFCMQTLRELKRAKYRDINYPFLAPVDVVALNIPDYLSIVKQPMDLSTIETKLNDGAYETSEEFEADIRLMFNNCYLYNPPVTPVHKMGTELEKAFDEKWQQKPELSQPEHDTIARLERDLVHISQKIAHIKSNQRGEARATGSRPAKQARTDTAAASSGSRPGQRNKRRRADSLAKPADELADFSFAQKKELSENINSLSSDRMNTVLSIIQSSMPNLGGEQDEIELDIDSLDRATLHRLHEFVTRNNSVSQKTKPNVKRIKKQPSEQADQKIHNVHPTPGDSRDDCDSSSGDDSDSGSGSGSDDSESSDSDT